MPPELIGLLPERGGHSRIHAQNVAQKVALRQRDQRTVTSSRVFASINSPLLPCSRDGGP